MAEAVSEKKKGSGKIGRFFREVKSEIKKIVWPTRQQVVNNTLIVLAAVIVIGAVLGILDFAFQYGLFKFI